MTPRGDLQLDRLARGNAQLQLDDVEPCHLLGDRVLDLDPAVQLEEVDVGAVDQELGRAGALVADRLRERDGAGGDPRPGGRVEADRGRLLDQLLMAALDRAVPRAENGDAAGVSEQLRLDMARPLEIPLAEHRPVAEGRLGLALGRRERVVQLGRGANDAHPPAAASGGSLDDERIADLGGRALRHGRHACLARDPLRRELVAAEPERLGRRADPGEPGGDHRLGEVAVLGQEAVAGMDGVGLGRECGANLLGGIEIRVDLDRPVRTSGVVGAAIVAGGDGDRLDPEPLAGPEDAGGDLAAVRNDEPADRHGCTLCRAVTVSVALVMGTKTGCTGWARSLLRSSWRR